MEGSFFYGLEGPLDAIPSERQMRAANFEGLPDLVRNRGGDPRRILERYGMDPRAIQDPDYHVDCKSLVDILEYCSTLFRDPLFGLRLAQHQDADVFGCVTALCRAAPSFRDAVHGLIDYIPVVHAPLAMMELAEGKETSELRWSVRTDLGVNLQAHYQAILLNLKLLRLVGGRGFRPSYVNLALDAQQKDIPEIEQMLGCPFHRKAAMNVIAFPTAILGQKVPTSNKLLFRLLGGYLERVKAASRRSIVERVEDYVRGALPTGQCSIERCAKKLGTPVRTLQAHLSDCGVRFSDVLEQQRIALAQAFIEEQQLSLDEIAVLLGYSEQSSFGRAFKRWTGSTPQRFRAERKTVPRKLC